MTNLNVGFCSISFISFLFHKSPVEVTYVYINISGVRLRDVEKDKAFKLMLKLRIFHTVCFVCA